MEAWNGRGMVEVSNEIRTKWKEKKNLKILTFLIEYSPDYFEDLYSYYLELFIGSIA